MVMSVAKISQKMKSKSTLRIEKNIIEWEKMLYCNYNDLKYYFEAISLV